MVMSDTIDYGLNEISNSTEVEVDYIDYEN